MTDRVEGSIASQDDELDLRELVLKLWARRGLILLCTGIGAVAAIIYALLATPFSGAEALLSIREDEPAQRACHRGGGSWEVWPTCPACPSRARRTRLLQWQP
jgi:hypothetical protein